VRKLRLDLFAALCIPYLLLVHRFWFVTDDAFISFRYARNFARGLGLRFNIGDQPPVEGYSNFLWVMICSIFEFFRMDIELWPPLVSSACGIILLWLVFDTIRRRLELPTAAAAAATTTLGCFPPLAVWSSGGLATAPFALLIFITFERLVLRKNQAAGVAAGVAALLLALLRLEGVAWAAVIIVLCIISRRMARQFKLRPVLVCALIVGIGYGIYFYWRYSYYESPLPNTAYAKAALDGPRLMRGFNYVFSFGLTFLTPFLLLPVSFVALRKKRRAVGLAVAAMAWAFPAYAVLVTGDFMAMGRFLIPGLAFASILLAWALTDLWGKSRFRRTATVVGMLGVIALGLLPGWDVHLTPLSVREAFRFRHNAPKFKSEFAKWQAQAVNTAEWTRSGKALRDYAAQRLADVPNVSYVASGMGARGYYSELYIYDRYGLIDRRVARRAVDADEPMRSAGHDKRVLKEYFLDDCPTILQAAVIKSANGSMLINACRREAAMMRSSEASSPIQHFYVVDFALVPADEPENDPQYIITWTRIPDGVDYRKSWADLERRLRATTGNR